MTVHLQLAPEWSHPKQMTVANLAYVFGEREHVIRAALWLAGDEIEYLGNDDPIPAHLLDAILSHAAEVHERTHGWAEPGAEPVTYATAITWLAATRHFGLAQAFETMFVPVPLGGYRRLPSTFDTSSTPIPDWKLRAL